MRLGRLALVAALFGSGAGGAAYAQGRPVQLDLTCQRRTVGGQASFYAVPSQPLPAGASISWSLRASDGGGPEIRGYILSAGGGRPAGVEIAIHTAPPAYDLCQATASWRGVEDPRSIRPVDRPHPPLDVVPPAH